MASNEYITFGKWLKQRRESLDLTQKELAYAAGCSLSTLRKMEAGSRQPSKQVAELLAVHLEIAPEEYTAFMSLAREGPTHHPQAPPPPPPVPHRPPIARPYAAPATGSKGQDAEESEASTWQPPLSQVPPPTNLPTPLTGFVGRRRVMDQVRSLLWRADVRLLTLTGPPGIGKTRLAIEAASSLRGDFTDGVFFVSLAPVNDPAMVLPAIVQALGVPGGVEDVSSLRRAPEAVLAEYLQDKNILLLLDNFEQVTGAAEKVARMLQSAPRLKALVTSRVPLHLYGEHELGVPPMELPGPGSALPADDLQQFEAVQLFIRRAQNSRTDFTVTSDDAAVIAEICRHLDALPLAIELAAARCKQYSPAWILSRMGDRFALLAGGPVDVPERHRTLHAALDWSYDLLDATEQVLFRRLGVFVSGFTAGAVALVLDSGPASSARSEHRRPDRRQVESRLESLVDKSLLKQESAGGEARFFLLETVREYAIEQLEAQGEEDQTRERHARYFLSLAEEGVNAAGTQQAAWLDRIEGEHDNIRSALGWLATQGAADASLATLDLRLAAAMQGFWSARGYFAEGREQVDRAIHNAGLLSHEALPPEGRLALAKAFDAGGWMARLQGDLSGARPYFESGLALSREPGDKQGIARMLNGLGQLALDRLSYEESLSMFEEALAVGREMQDRVLMARTLNNIANVRRNTMDYATAMRCYEESASLFRELGDNTRLVAPLTNLGLIAMDLEDYAAARRYQEEGLAICLELGDKESLVFLLAFVGQRAMEEQDFDKARQAFTEALPVVGEMDYKLVLALCLEGIAAMQAELSHPREAARLWAKAEAIREAMNLPLPLPSHPKYERRLALARSQAGAMAFDAAWSAGRAMSTSNILSFALECLGSTKQAYARSDILRKQA